MSLTVICFDPRLPPSFGDLGTNFGTNVVTIPSSVSVFPSFSCNMAPNFLTTDGLPHLRSTKGYFGESEKCAGRAGTWGLSLCFIGGLLTDFSGEVAWSFQLTCRTRGSSQTESLFFLFCASSNSPSDRQSILWQRG